MIARLWSGAAWRTGETPGNRGAWILRRDQGDRTEFITMSFWDSVDAIRAFAGDDIDAAVLYPRTSATSSAIRPSPTTRSSTSSSPTQGQARTHSTRFRECRQQ
jgi:hypothetical protein